MKRIYLDYASITLIDPFVRKEMDKWSHEPLNPSSIHSLGIKAKKAMESSRKSVAEFLNAHSDEIIFTSGGTEANSLVLEGAARARHEPSGDSAESFAKSAAFKNGTSKPHLIISAIEHSSILEIANMLEKHGVEVTRLAVDKNGLVSLEQLKKSITPKTFLVSIMTANNEIGTIQPIREIAKVIRDFKKLNQKKEVENRSRESVSVIPAKAGIQGQTSDSISKTMDSRFHGNDKLNNDNKQDFRLGTRDFRLAYPLFHTDACQAVLYQDLDVEKLGVDLLTLDASKACGPRGIGALYAKRGTPIEPLIYGGGQENGLRSGTENIPGIVGFAKALELDKKNMVKETQRILELRNYFEKEVKKIRPDAIVNAADIPDLPSSARYQNISHAPDVNRSRHVNFENEKVLRVPHISNISFPGSDAEMLVLRLDAKGIAVSTKSACLKDEDESYVLRAIGADSKSSIRFSFGRWTKKADIKKTLVLLKKFLP
jgi:cysteine desulfurase